MSSPFSIIVTTSTPFGRLFCTMRIPLSTARVSISGIEGAALEQRTTTVMDEVSLDIVGAKVHFTYGQIDLVLPRISERLYKGGLCFITPCLIAGLMGCCVPQWAQSGSEIVWALNSVSNNIHADPHTLTELLQRLVRLEKLPAAACDASLWSSGQQSWHSGKNRVRHLVRISVSGGKGALPIRAERQKKWGSVCWLIRKTAAGKSSGRPPPENGW
jgi:hypothetical protein